MPDFITLSCPTCGGKLQITNEVERFACGHCGNEHIVKRIGGTVAIAPIVEGLIGIKSGVDRSVSELALVRLRTQLDKYHHERNTLSTAEKSLSSDIGPIILIIFGIIFVSGFFCLLIISIINVVKEVKVDLGGIVAVLLIFSALSLGLIHLGKLKAIKNRELGKVYRNSMINLDQVIEETQREYDYHFNNVRDM